MEVKKWTRAVSAVWVRIRDRMWDFRSRAHLWAPGIFGMPVRGPLVQFYRNDEFFRTQVSLINYLSVFSPDVRITQLYRVSVFDRKGSLLGRAEIEVGPGATVQKELSELTGYRLDEYGIFSVDSDYRPSYSQAIEFLGETSPQFMTLYVPRDGKSGPQMVHSHKMFESIPVPRGTTSRVSSSVEDLGSISDLEAFVLNSGPWPLKGRLVFSDIHTGVPVVDLPFQAPGHGVARVSLDLAKVATSQEVAIRIEHNRKIQHRKPILFRTSKSGLISCNHL